MDWLENVCTVSLTLSGWQQLGLAFLLGSFAVATLSDVRYLAAQREFVEVWLLFLVGVLIRETYDLHTGALDAPLFGIKWGLIAVLSLLSLNRVGVLFRLAWGDVAALAATSSLLPPMLVILFYAIALGLSALAQRFVWRGRTHVPFMPVVSLATVAVLALGWLA